MGAVEQAQSYRSSSRIETWLNLQPSTLNPQPSTLDLQPSTLNPQPATLNSHPSTPNPQPSTLNPRPSTLNPQPSTFFFFCITLELKIEWYSNLRALHTSPSWNRSIFLLSSCFLIESCILNPAGAAEECAAAPLHPPNPWHHPVNYFPFRFRWELIHNGLNVTSSSLLVKYSRE